MKKLDVLVVPSICRRIGNTARDVIFIVRGHLTDWPTKGTALVFVYGDKGTTGGSCRFNWNGRSLSNQLGALELTYEQTTHIEAAIRRGGLKFQ